MSAPYFATGSGEKAGICFVDGDTAAQVYGVSKFYAINCPSCHGPINALLSFNPTNSNFYLAPCPLCGRFLLYCGLNGDPVQTFSEVRSNKRTPLDQDLDDFVTHTGTF